MKWTHVFFIAAMILPHISFALDIDKMRGKKPTASESQIKTKKMQSENHFFYLGFNIYSKSILASTSQSTGKKDYLSAPLYPISFSYAYKFNENFRLKPQLDYTIFNKKGEDGGTETNDLLLALPLLKRLSNQSFEVKLGIVFHQNRTIGHGGTVTLNNGSSTTDFYLPNRTETSNTFCSDFGLAYEFENFLFQADLLIEAVANNSKRNFALLTGLTYKLGSF